jgi:type IV secretory pathway VirJ component
VKAIIAVVLILIASSVVEAGRIGEQLDCPLRGRTLMLSVYRPAGEPKGTVIMGSGDVGWVGLGVAMAEFLSAEGYIVVGVNVRQYLASFTTSKSHLSVDDPPADYAAIADLLKTQHLLHGPIVVSGVSEGAALAVLVASSPKNHEWIRGVVTMGIPPSAELAWKWSDFTAWIMKKDAREPSFAPQEYIASVSPVPLVMIQSTKDEYVTEADYRAIEAVARPPKKLVLIEASNHRFTDRRKELQREYLAALEWIKESHP